MGLDTLYDPDKGMAFLYCNTSDRPLALEGFNDQDDGTTGAEVADRFAADAAEHFGVEDVRALAPDHLAAYQEAWFRDRDLATETTDTTGERG